MTSIRSLIFESDKPIKRDYSADTLNPGYANSIAKTLDGDRKAMVLGVKVFDVVRNISNVPYAGFKALSNGWDVHLSPTPIEGNNDEAFEKLNGVVSRINVSIRKGNRSISLKVFVNHEGKVVTIGKVDLSGSITYKPLNSDDINILRDFKKENQS